MIKCTKFILTEFFSSNLTITLFYPLRLMKIVFHLFVYGAHVFLQVADLLPALRAYHLYSSTSSSSYTKPSQTDDLKFFPIFSTAPRQESFQVVTYLKTDSAPQTGDMSDSKLHSGQESGAKQTSQQVSQPNQIEDTDHMRA